RLSRWRWMEIPDGILNRPTLQRLPGPRVRQRLLNPRPRSHRFLRAPAGPLAGPFETPSRISSPFGARVPRINARHFFWPWTLSRDDQACFRPRIGRAVGRSPPGGETTAHGAGTSGRAGAGSHRGHTRTGGTGALDAHPSLPLP